MTENFEFSNTPLTDFTGSDARAAFARALNAIESRLPIEVCPGVASERVTTGDTFSRPNPSDTAQAVATVHCANEAHVDKAVEAARNAWPAWRDTPIEKRAALLEALGGQLEQHRLELAALEVYEAGKPWREADADVAEAIDFCRFYARLAPIELGRQPCGVMTGERNERWYEGRGVATVIAPWNFPIAIFTGMSMASLVAGNTVIMKPAEQSSACGQRVFELLQACGLPKNVVQFLPGVGETVGAALVDHPDVCNIAFTGSKAVGLHIIERAGITRDGQAQVKRVTCEMGGKNGIVIDEDADLDEAVSGVVHSAFGYSGQKCSACSRVIVHRAIYDPFRERLREAVASLHVAPATDPECQVGPVIDEEAHQRLLGVLSNPSGGARELFQAERREGGFYVPPSLFEVDTIDHRMMQDEFFGPILAMIPCDDFEDGISKANATQYALTGGVYSRNPERLAYAERHFRVGNLYFNRGITGAFVNRQPFGGFKMSGAGTKAGGGGYLTHFADPRSVTENTMRHGFAPDLDA
jgi:RHH-type transcriptional regulator, proline utilization regulon repressor / proline dehydrogenase / delta 1-pyrroline-5-carboxylate dehydrogenase